MGVRENVPKILREERDRRKMTQKDFAAFLGYDSKAYQKWEVGKNIPHALDLEVIEQKLNLESGIFFRRR